MATYKYESMMKILAIIGGLLALVFAILSFAGMGFWVFFGYGGEFFGPIIVIILAIIVILSVIKPKTVPFHWLLLLILGILILIFGNLIAGILIIIAGILGIAK